MITYRGHLNNHVTGRVIDYRTGPVMERRSDGSLMRLRSARPASELLAAVKAAGGFTQINHPTIFPSSVPGFGNDIAATQGGALATALLGLTFLGALTAAGGVIAGFIAWIGAVLNTWQLESKAWFVALVLTGIFNFGFIAMVIYVIAGPDGKAARTAQPAGLPVGA